MDVAELFAETIGENDENLGIRGFLDTGIPELNYALSGSYQGGIPMGRMIEMFGPASCGKTFLATMIMKAAQDAGGMAVFADHERSFEPILAQSLGLDLNPSKFRYLRPKTFEESIQLATTAAVLTRQRGFDVDKPIVWVFDSVASMVPHEKMYDDKGKLRKVGDFNMRDKLALATACSQNYPQLAQFAEDNNMTVILLNQIRMKPGVLYGDPTTTPGGNAAEFFCSQRISIGRQMITEGAGKDKREIGFKVSAKLVKNKVARPFLKASWQVRFNEGLGVRVDRIATILDFLIRKGLIEKSGNYIVWGGKKLYQSQLEKLLREDDDAEAKLMAMVPESSEGLEDVAESDIDAALDDMDLDLEGEAEADIGDE